MTVLTAGGGSGLESLIQSKSISGVASVEFTTGIDSTFDEHLVRARNITVGTTDVVLHVTISDDAGSTWKAGSDYLYSARTMEGNSATSMSGNKDTAGAHFNLDGDTTNYGINNGAGFHANFDMQMFNLASTTLHPIFLSRGVHILTGATNQAGQNFTGAIWDGDATAAINGIKITVQSGVMTGDFHLYGVSR